MIAQPKEVITHLLPADDRFPNNPKLPLMVYKQAFQGSAADVERILKGNGWRGTWGNGVYSARKHRITDQSSDADNGPNLRLCKSFLLRDL